jgi:CRISPR-associated endonuclease/helicase Cas3
MERRASRALFSFIQDSGRVMTAPAERVLSELWAKSAKDSDPGESLVGHTATVLSRLKVLFTALPGIADRFGDDRLWHRAALACLLHDFGKAAAGFQAQLRSRDKPWKQRHEVLSLAFLPWLLANGGDDLPWIAAGIVCHHRDLPEILASYSKLADAETGPAAQLVDDLPDDSIAALAAFFEERFVRPLRQIGLPLREFDAAIPANPISDLRENGEARIYGALREARRLCRDLAQIPSSDARNIAALALRGLILMADHTASAHVRPQPTPFSSVEGVIDKLGLTPANLFGHQREAADRAGGALLTAPTGSGKTEAAILWAARQYQSAGPIGRLYYVLPYQASLNAMKGRLESHFPDAVSLQHSRALQALYRMLLEGGSGYSPDQAAAAAYRQRSLARLHYHPIRVLTPYQLLRAAFRLKGYEALLTDTFNGLFVFDEIHAYEPDRLGMILGMSEYLHANFGARFLVMSATFPAIMRQGLESLLDDAAPIAADDCLYKQFQRHRVRLLAGALHDPANIASIVEAARLGRSVLAVCNTVDGARDLHRQVANHLGPVELLHGRFNARDRFRKEKRLLDLMGTHRRDRNSSPIVMVATQVVEVSLDLDFDTLFSEPAPLESLLQRFGRVNRARKHSLSDVHVATAPLDGHGIYQPEYVAGALRVLSDIEDRPLDESRVGDWLDSIYRGDLADKWRSRVETRRQEFIQTCLKDLRAFESKPEFAKAFDDLFDGTEVLPAALADEYRRFEEPLAASELLVPMSSKQLGRARAQGRIISQPRKYPIVVNLPYNPDTGLQLKP